MSEELDLEADATGITPSLDALANVSQLVQRQLKWEAAVADAEAALKHAKENLRQVSERDLPEALIAAGVRTFTTDDGVRVGIEDEFTMSIPRKNKAAANAWLRANGLEALVKPTVIVEFKKGQHNEQAQVTEFLDKNGFSYTKEDTANTASVKAAFNKRMEKGEPVDLDLFGGFHRKVAVIKLPTQ